MVSKIINDEKNLLVVAPIAISVVLNLCIIQCDLCYMQTHHFCLRKLKSKSRLSR